MTGTTTARVLALDLSLTATGVAHPDGTLDTIRPPAGAGDGRLVVIRDRVADLVGTTAPTLVVIEGPVTRSQAATVIGMVHGAVRVHLIDAGVPYLIVPPAVLKKYATGRGNAQKGDMRMALYRRTGRDSPDDNKVDAAWLRLIALDLAGQAEVTMPVAHRQALERLEAVA